MGRGFIAHRHAGQLHHAPGQIDDADRLAHIENEDLASTGHGTGLQHQLGGLGDGHEIAGDIGVGHGQRAPGRQLAPKQRHHAPAGTQHIAKADHAEAGRRAMRGCLCGHRLQHQFRHAFAGAHDIGWPDGLVGGDQHKTGNPTGYCGLRHVQRAKHIVVDAHRRVGLHNRNMFVGRGMVNRMGAVGLAYLMQPLHIGHTAQQRHQLHNQP